MPLVPPGVAHKRGEAERQRVRKQANVKTERPEWERTDPQTIGSRRTVYEVVKHYVQQGAIEQEGTRYRLRRDLGV